MRIPQGIKEQLWLEEALLRHNRRNWCILKDGLADRSKPTIVLGIGGKPAKLVNLNLAARDGIPLLRRFSGGGTVIVDKDSLFVTFIMNTDEVTPREPYPRPIMQWTAGVYSPVFSRLLTINRGGYQPFELRENDYVFGELKFGGNAQSIIKDRWLHHTSFLWDFNDANMGYLTIPEKRPDYRKDRDHSAFLVRLKSVISHHGREALFEELQKELAGQFNVEQVEEEEVRALINDELGGMDAWSTKARTQDVPIEIGKA